MVFWKSITQTIQALTLTITTLSSTKISTTSTLLLLYSTPSLSDAFSFPIPDSKGYYDRFKATCPADISSIHQFNPSLVDDPTNDKNDIWAAVYRSSNNLPSVFLKDEFLNAMDIATSTAISKNPNMIETKEETVSNSGISSNSSEKSDGVSANVPVAVARLRPMKTTKKWIIDSMRCTLKKEDTNPLCDGGSEHAEALSICIDELLMEHLTRQNQKQTSNEENGGNIFEAALRCKATLVAAPLFEARGFVEVTELSQDMATHTSRIDASMDRYAARVADVGNENVLAKSPGARDRALKILSLLGQLDSDREKEAAMSSQGMSGNGMLGEDDDYDPWAGVKKFY